MMGGQGGVDNGTAGESMDRETQEFLPLGLTTTNPTFREGRSYVDKEREKREKERREKKEVRSGEHHCRDILQERQKVKMWAVLPGLHGQSAHGATGGNRWGDTHFLLCQGVTHLNLSGDSPCKHWS